MKKVLLASLLTVSLFAFTSCRKSSTTPVAPEELTVQSSEQSTAVYYDFVVNSSNTCSAATLTINNCGTGAYTSWQSTVNCSGGNSFNGTVVGSGNPLLTGSPATFPNIGATYHIFTNTAAVKDVLQIVFKTGYNATHKPTINYNTATRKFTIVNAGNPTYVTVRVFSYRGIIGPGGSEFC